MSDSGDSLGGFLRSRRARLTPEEVGLVSYGTRRVPGLRREELAQLAGVSLTYYTRLEQGQAMNVSDAVINAIGRVLNLDDDERAHLHTLARPVRHGREPQRTGGGRAGTVRLIEAMADVPAAVLDRRSDVLAWNRLGHALLACHLDFAISGGRPPNLTRMLFLDDRTRALYPDWEREALRAVASLRLVAGRYPDDRGLAELVGELTVKSPEFASLWADHPVRTCFSGRKRFRHPQAGDMELEFGILHVPDDSWQRIMTYHTIPGSPSDAALRLLSALAHARPALTGPDEATTARQTGERF
ncbi:helix-turn-helix transcriptional regulator [Microbispora rosea]|uniref:helix-turn-helix transcriptional regulator n=1 Tax=Microbispora rosea TaxID=58117 RepID=UPI0034405105